MKPQRRSDRRSSVANGGHAAVIGGSLAGLVTARVLADHFSRVSVLERDRFPEEPDHRRGVPQARHVHILLPRGAMILGALFPGLENDLLRAGAVEMDAARDLALLSRAGWGVRFESGYRSLPCSRDLLDCVVRRRLAALPQISIRELTAATGLVAAGNRVRGVRVGSGTTGTEDLVEADLVVDASGRGSRASRWLQDLGYPAPQETVIDAQLAYASRIYRRSSPLPGDWKAVYLQPAPPRTLRGGLLFPLEGDRWLLSLLGSGNDPAPTDEEAFLDFMRGLPSPLIYEAIRDEEPLTPVYGQRATANRLRHYDRLPSRPEGFVVLGDAACAFNPVYGQGMSTAALGAMALDRCLRERRHPDLSGLARTFQKRLAKVTAGPWLLATGEDLRNPHVTGASPSRATRLTHRYMNHVLELCNHRSDIRRIFLEVLGMLKTPPALFGPKVLFPTLRSMISWGGGTGEGHIDDRPPVTAMNP